MHDDVNLPAKYAAIVSQWRDRGIPGRPYVPWSPVVRARGEADSSGAANNHAAEPPRAAGQKG